MEKRGLESNRNWKNVHDFLLYRNKLLKTKVRMIQISGLVEHVKIQEADKAKGQAHSHMSLKVDK